MESVEDDLQAEHVRTSTEYGPDFCKPCSDAAGDWVTWPCAGASSSDPGAGEAAHHRNCYQTKGVPQSLLDEGLSPDLCDCKILWMLEARKMSAGWTCPTRCVELNHPGREHEQWMAGVHDCATCADCIHDGRRCCGCYDGACCKSPDWSAAPALSDPA